MEMSHTKPAVQAVIETYRKAPITIGLFASYFLSQIVSKIWLDYRLFVALPGGPLPKNIFGWAVHYFVLSPLSLHSSWTSTPLVRCFLPKTSLQKGALSIGASIPKRRGARALTAGTIPHRQLDQFQSKANDVKAAKKEAEEAVNHILSTLQNEADAQPSHVRIGPSQIESDSTALFAISHTLVTETGSVSRSTRSAQFPSALSRRFLSSVKGEFIHVHNIPGTEDGSLHLTLHAEDAVLVVEKGWGELHPLAGFPSYSGFWIGWPAWLSRLRTPSTGSARWWSSSSLPKSENSKVSKAKGLPPTYCLLYSPRNMDEARVVEDIIKASIAFAIGSRSTSRS